MEKLLASLSTDTFVADDSLGWVYQFWQTKKKKEVNESGEKIDGRTLPAVTQLFTEPYMVKFLLHNTIGAWWAGRQGIGGQGSGISEEELRRQVALPHYEFDYLRFLPDGTPAAGTFDGWPALLKEFTMLDPCCGSGHFLVEAFNLLVPMRMQDEGLSAQEASDAVLAENLFGLELDPRCTQIAAFALALAAWKFRDESGEPLGYRPLPPVNIACSGQSVTGKKEEWFALANGHSRLREGMGKLYDLFAQAPHLGSLIDPRREGGDLFVAGFTELQPLLEKALAKEKVQQDADTIAVGVAAQGIARAAELLLREYTLVATNVPYLGRGDQAEFLSDFCEQSYSLAKGDIATTFLARSFNWTIENGTIALVTPWNWLFLTSYTSLRRTVLTTKPLRSVIRLGEKAFENSQAAGAFAALTIFSDRMLDNLTMVSGMDVSKQPSAAQKAEHLIYDPIECIVQKELLSNPDYVISTRPLSTLSLLDAYAQCYQGTSTGDNPRYVICFWELDLVEQGWEPFQVAPEATTFFSGRHLIVRWNEVERAEGAAIRGELAWQRRGIAIGQMRSLPATLYTGSRFSNTTPVIIPNDDQYLPAVWHFCTSHDFFNALRSLNPKLSVDNGYVGKIAFDLSQWTAVAEAREPIPEPHSDDPTQWLFKGDIPISTDPLQVAVARMLGYRWPEQPKEKDSIDVVADEDGIVCVPTVRSERPAAERLTDVLHAAYGSE